MKISDDDCNYKIKYTGIDKLDESSKANKIDAVDDLKKANESPKTESKI